MNSQEQLLLVINNVFSNDNLVRAQAEQQLAGLRDQYPNEFIVNMLLLCRSEDLKVRQFAPVHIRNCLSMYTHKSHKNIWKELKKETQDHVKIALFQLLEFEESANVRSQLCDAIGEIGGSLYEEEQNNGWPELVPTIWKLFLSPKSELIECGFKILSTLFTYALEMFGKYQNDINTLFLQGLASPDNRIKTATIQAIGNYVTSAEPKQYKPFEELTNNLMQAALQVVVSDQNLGEDVMEVFSDIIETEHKFFRKYFNIFFNGLAAIFSDQKVDQGVKRIGTDTLIVFAEKSPKLFKSDKIYLQQLVQMIFFHMIQISATVSDEWKMPAEGFNDDIEQDDDCETTRFGMSSIDRLIEYIGDKEMLPILSAAVNQLLIHPDWRYKYAAIMALSQVGEYVEEVSEIKPIIDLVAPMLSDANPMIRYAVCHAIGQIADDMKPKFQDTYLHIIVPQFLTRLQVEDVQRVTSHILAALTNFVEGTQKGIQTYLQNLVQFSVSFLQNGISLVKENAMSVIAATAESSKQDFIPYIQELIPLLFQVFQKHQSKEYKQLKGQTIETITLIASSVGAQIYEPYLEQTVQLLLAVQEGTFEAQDPCKSYVLSGWQRLALVCPKQLSVYLPRIIPSLFQLVKLVFDLHGGLGKSNSAESDKKDEEFHTYDNEEAEIAIHMLAVFIEELKETFFPYVDVCTQLIVPLCKFQTDENIRRASAKCLVSLIENAKATNQSQATQQGAKYFLGVILDAAKSEFDPEVIIDQVDCLKEIIDQVNEPFLTAQEVNELSDKVFKLLLESDQRKTENENLAKEEDVDEDDMHMIKEENDTEEELHVKIAELIGTLFKTHKDYIGPLFELICSTILPRVLDSQLSAKMHQFGIFLIDDIVEHLGYNIAGTKFIDFAKALAIYATDKVCFVRQAAVYGIGIMAINTPKDQYPIIGGILLNAVVESLRVEYNKSDTEKQFGHAKDNSIAALGKIIKNQPESLGIQLGEALQMWLQLLPLKFDKPEARIQHKYLAELIIHNGNLLINGKQENALQILRILANVVNTKRSNQEVDALIIQALQVFEQLELVKLNIKDLFSILSQEDQQRLLSLNRK